jgi:WD repeat and SOF domain-containing protein 1
MDSKYIVTGSEDTNIRVWKSNASESLKPLLPREKESLAYANKLKKKFKNNTEIKRILRHRHLPKLLMKKQKNRQATKESKHRKKENMRANNRVEDVPFVPQRRADMDSR